jgi:magnesium chelatase family protein
VRRGAKRSNAGHLKRPPLFHFEPLLRSAGSAPARAKLRRRLRESGDVLSRIGSATISGIDAVPVDVEVQVRGGAPSFTIIGLGDGAVREARDRVLCALRSSGANPPSQILVNLAPAELRKEGASFDLSIAVGILAASGQAPTQRLDRCAFHGELSLDGRVKPVRGILALAIAARKKGARTMVVPRENAREAALIDGIEIAGVGSLGDVQRFLRGEALDAAPQTADAQPPRLVRRLVSDVWGQQTAKRALRIAAAGAHNLLMIGPPGCGKSMLAERFPSLLPPLTREESLEVVRIQSIAGLPVDGALRGLRPFRNPHYAVSDAGLIGGGTHPRPGEISLAHLGVLFLDEFPEFRRSAIEALRTPLEGGVIHVGRVRGNCVFPARFQLLAAMNPCPCGRLGARGAQCLCPRTAVYQYLRRLSQPILDRIDLHVELEMVPLAAVACEPGTRDEAEGESQEDAWREEILLARERQFARGAALNSALDTRDLIDRLDATADAVALVRHAAEKNAISARGFLRILKVARTIADLEGAAKVTDENVAEALSFRCLERIERYCTGA